MKCMICGLGMAEGVSLFRQNKKGEPGIWACRQHRMQKPDPEVEQIVAVIEAKKEQPK